MLSELSGTVMRIFHAQLEACEAMCFAADESGKAISVLIVDSTYSSTPKVEYMEHEGHSYEVLSVTDLRMMFRLDHIEVFAGFLKRCVVLKDEYQDLFDTKRTFGTIVHSELSGIADRPTGAGPAAGGRTGHMSSNHRSGYFSSITGPDAATLADNAGYRVLCTGIPQIHRFIRRQCFGLLEELKDVTRSMEFAFYRNSRQPQSVFSIELLGIDHLNKAEFEKRLSLFCAQRNRYPGPVNFRLFSSNFGTEARAAFAIAVSRGILTEFYPKTTSSQGFTTAITPHVVALLLLILKSDDLGTAMPTIDKLVHDQLHRILRDQRSPGEITSQEKIAYQLDLHTDTQVITHKAGIMGQMGHGLRFRNKAIYEDGIFQAFRRWLGTARPSVSEATGLLFDSFCVSPHRSYYFLRSVQALLNEKG
ncbi:MAG: hypothetical protein JSU02_07300 [Bacteroidetes bacterium]|nr:hypothetical protein [Bacteroidota bacterium]